jgi:hypothetical protein
MILVRSIALVAAMWVMLGCGDTVEDSARRQGISREDARDIIRSLRAEKHPHAIYQFDRVPSGILLVHTDIGDFLVERSAGKWEFTELVFH